MRCLWRYTYMMMYNQTYMISYGDLVTSPADSPAECRLWHTATYDTVITDIGHTGLGMDRWQRKTHNGWNLLAHMVHETLVPAVERGLSPTPHLDSQQYRNKAYHMNLGDARFLLWAAQLRHTHSSYCTGDGTLPPLRVCLIQSMRRFSPVGSGNLFPVWVASRNLNMDDIS